MNLAESVMHSYTHCEDQSDHHYREEHVVFKSGDNYLAGTLTVPQFHDGRNEACLAVVLVHGSGPFSRDAVVYPHRPFFVIADYLSKRGIAVLRYDKRGVGESSGTMEGITTFDLSDDTAAGVEFLRHHSAINPKRIGLIGQSEGGIVSSIAASRDERIAFVVLMGAPAVTGEEILLAQTETFSRVEGYDTDAIVQKINEARQVYEVVKSEPDQVTLWDKLWPLIWELSQNGLTPPPNDATVFALTRPWFRCFIQLDPAEYIAKIKCPVLAIYGTSDTQVLAEQNLAAVKMALAESNNLTALELPKLNHMLQHCETGLPDEYSQIKEAISPAVLLEIKNWIYNV